MIEQGMDLSALLGHKLKDDDVIEILEGYDIEVVYEFDRLHDNLPDVYWASVREAGFQLRFNEDQVLGTIFCYVVAKDGFSPIAPAIIGAPVYKTFDDAEQACKSHGLRYSTSDATKAPPHRHWWLRVEAPEHWSHYQLENGLVALVTLSRPGE